MAAAHCHIGRKDFVRASSLRLFKVTTNSESNTYSEASLLGIIHAIPKHMTMKRPHDKFVSIIDEDSGNPSTAFQRIYLP
jgi:hypothetical protein